MNNVSEEHSTKEWISNPNSYKSKNEMYSALIEQVESIVEGERDCIANCANVCSLVFHELNNFRPNLLNWCGFYFVRKEQLVLGPFQGKPACIRIAIGKGVCGTAVKKKASIVVKDVAEFPGHIACDSASKSEIVIPIFFESEEDQEQKIKGVLDLDSVEFSAFDEEDQTSLERITQIIAKSSDWKFII